MLSGLVGLVFRKANRHCRLWSAAFADRVAHTVLCGIDNAVSFGECASSAASGLSVYAACCNNELACANSVGLGGKSVDSGQPSANGVLNARHLRVLGVCRSGDFADIGVHDRNLSIQASRRLVDSRRRNDVYHRLFGVAVGIFGPDSTCRRHRIFGNVFVDG